MTALPEKPYEQTSPSWELGSEPNGPPPQTGPAKPSWLDSFRAELGARFEASQQAIAAIPRPMALAAAAILILPAALGLLAQSYIGGVQQKLGITLTGPDGAPDQVTALWWSNSADQHLVVGTRSGALLTLGAQANLRDRRTIGAPIVDIEQAADGSLLPVTLAPDQVVTTPTGSLGRASGFGLDTCRSGYVWREATVDDLVCVPPSVRDQARADRAEAEAGRGVAAGCAGGLVPRRANPNDNACTAAQIAADIPKDNKRNESRKLLPGAAFAGARRVQLSVAGGTIAGERGLLAVSGSSIIAGERTSTVLNNDGTTKQAVDIPQPTDVVGLAQWSLADARPARASEVGALEDVRVLARQPGTQMVYAGDAAGTIYEINASEQMSGTNPTAYLRELGKQGSPVSTIAVAAAPAAGMPSFVTAAENGTLVAWWPERPEGEVAGRVLVGGSSWNNRSVTTLVDENSSTTGSAPTRQQIRAFRTERNGDAVTVNNDGSVALMTAPVIGDGPIPNAKGLAAPFASTSDGLWSSAYDPSSGSIVIFDGLFRAAVRNIAVAGDIPARTVLSPSGGELLIIRGDGTAMLATMFEGADTELNLPAGARYAAFNPSGTQLAIGLDDGSVALVRTQDRTLLEIILPRDGLGGGGEGVNVLALDVRYTSTGRQLVLFDPNSAQTATYGIRMRHLSDWRQVDTAPDVIGGQLSEDGKRIVTSRGDGTLTIFDRESGMQLGSIATTGATSWAVSPDAGIIAVAVNTTTVVFEERPNLAADAPPLKLAPHGLTISADGSTLMAREQTGSLHLWDIRERGSPRILAANLATDLTAVAAELAPDGSFVVIADSAGGVYLIELPGLHRIGIAGHGSLVQRMLLSADGRLLASASLDGVVQITDLVRARQIGALPLVTTPIGQRRERPQPTLLADQPQSIDRTAQQFLESAGYGPVPIDGVLGIATRAAVARWQRDNALPPTGVPDQALLSQAAPARQSAN